LTLTRSLNFAVKLVHSVFAVTYISNRQTVLMSGMDDVASMCLSGSELDLLLLLILVLLSPSWNGMQQLLSMLEAWSWRCGCVDEHYL